MTIPRGSTASRSPTSPRRPASRATTSEGEREPRRASTREVRRRERAQPRGLPVPGDLRAVKKGPRRTTWSRAARRLRAEHRRGRPRLRQGEEPDPLRRPDHRLDDRARDPGARGAPSSRAVIYNRLEAGMPAGDRRHDPLRGLGNYDEPLIESRARRADSPYNTRINAGPAADADRQPRPRLARGRRQPRRGRLLLLRDQAGDLRRAHLRRDRGGVRPAAGHTQACRPRAAPRPTAERRAPAVAAAAAQARRPRPAGRALALAGDAERRARRARARRPSGPTRRSRSRRSIRALACADAPAAASRART